MEQDKKSCICCGQVKTLDHFKMTRWGKRVNVCTECANQKARDNKIRKQQEQEMAKAREDAKKSERQKMLEQYTPRELMEELARRGYTGELTYTMRIDITNF
jgi:ribosome-binding protein aMBF1 (putative translation factor)